MRSALLGFGAACLLVIGAVVLEGFILPGLIVLGFWLALMVVGLLIERWRYKRDLSAPPAGPGWSKTPERFVDPETGQATTVWTRAATGERAYVAEAERSS